MTGKEICLRITDCVSLKYWYGGKGELATVQLAARLKKENPKVWNDSYYAKAVQDCNNVNHVGDCSYLVCHAYNIGMISSYAIEAKYSAWHGSIPKDGMILWRKGHVGIYEAGKVHELRGINYDYQFNKYAPAEWSKVLYDPNVQYDSYDLGWNQNQLTKQWWYQYGYNKEDYYHNEIKEINGHAYAFGSDGYMLEGTFTCTTDENGEIIALSQS